MLTLKVSELFYSLQGEGRRAGDPSIFIRLQGCSAKHACYQHGIRCDTEFESGSVVPIEDLLHRMVALQSNVYAPCEWIIWTGGEPLDQLTPAHLEYFGSKGYKHALETSGTKRIPDGCVFDWVCISPKVAEHVLEKNFDGVRINELRYVRHTGQGIPQPSLLADNYMLSPHSDGQDINLANLKHCINLCLKHPEWSLSVQQHKLWGVL